MNLVFDPWIPVTLLDGQPTKVSLFEVFINGHNYADLAVRPHERIALMRLLICIGNAALNGPEESSELDDVCENLPERAEAYLKEWKDNFELFHDRHPFLQQTNIKKLPKKSKKGEEIEFDTTPISKLDFSLATGNNTTLFDHLGAAKDNRVFSFPEQALALLTFQCFSPGGLIGKLIWEDQKADGAGSSKHAPCTPSSMLHTFIRGPNLLQSIVKNLLTKSQIEDHFGTGHWGKPIWEMLPSGPKDKVAIENATLTYLGRLVPLSRLIRLLPGDTNMLLGDGLNYSSFPEFPAEPSASVKFKSKEKTDRILFRAELDKAIWRELHALSIARTKDSVGGALALANLPENEACDLWIGAFVTDKAQILDTLESVCHLPAGMRLNQGLLMKKR
jgi:CRISPR system Cascade subunit CasA